MGKANFPKINVAGSLFCGEFRSLLSEQWKRKT